MMNEPTIEGPSKPTSKRPTRFNLGVRIMPWKLARSLLRLPVRKANEVDHFVVHRLAADGMIHGVSRKLLAVQSRVVVNLLYK